MDFLYRNIPAMISATIAYILLFKVWKNPLRLIGNTVKKKILSFIIIGVLFFSILTAIEYFDVNYKEAYDSLLLGVVIMVNGRLLTTDFEGKDAYKKNEE